MVRSSALCRLVIVSCFLVAVLMLPGIASAGPLTTPVFSPWLTGGTASEPATITGYVRDASGVGIQGIRVEATGDTVSTNEQAVSFVQWGVTDADGKYVITDIIEGTYALTVNPVGYDQYNDQYAEAWPWYDWTQIWGESGTDTRMGVIGGLRYSADATLTATGIITGRAWLGTGGGVQGCQIVARGTDGMTQYTRWDQDGTDVDGRYWITDAPKGDWTIEISGSGKYVPVDGSPASWSASGDPATVGTASTTLTEDGYASGVDCEFVEGAPLLTSTWEVAGSSYNLSSMGVTLRKDNGADDPTLYYFSTGDDGWLRDVYVPVGEYQFTVSDPDECYESYVETITLAAGTPTNKPVNLTPIAANSFVVKGRMVRAENTAEGVSSWVNVEAKTAEGYDHRKRVPSDGLGNYLVRLPRTTGYTGNKYRLTFREKTSDVRGATPDHTPHAFETYYAGATPITHNSAMALGGRIQGVIHDEAGNTVPGVQISALTKQADGWNGDYAWTVSGADGTYRINGLPANTDYKLNVMPYYDSDGTLPKEYASYYRRSWKGFPLADSLNTSTTPVAPDHTPINLALGATFTADETITPGGLVALHTDGPEYPTGAVYCDVMYQIGSKWVEVDSGFTTGGTFQKLWKTLPTGVYRLDYSDYFGRGGGSWSFTLAPHEEKYASVLVPAPVEFLSSDIPTSTGGAFLGMIGDAGMPGGAGDVGLEVDKLTSMPTSVALPSSYISGGGIYDFSAVGTQTTDGVWTLTIPYNPTIPADVVANLRVRHVLKNGSVEILAPVSVNPVEHTLMVQTTSLSPFQVLYNRVKASLGTPIAPSHGHAYRSFSVYGTLKPHHTRGGKSVQLKVYRYSSGRYRYYKTVTATNYDYYSYTKYRASLKLRAGKYRIYGYAPYDTWHYATTTSKYDSLTVR